MKPILIILSDISGIHPSNWIQNYVAALSSNYDIRLYDSCEIGKIDTNSINVDIRHLQFINGGIDVAVKKLIELEKNEIDILAFSIGGTIAWKAALAGLKVKNLYAVSATRLRLETAKPDCKINLFYGEKDDFKPALTWFKKIELIAKIIEKGNHTFYTNKNQSIKICKSIKVQHDFKKLN